MRSRISSTCVSLASLSAAEPGSRYRASATSTGWSSALTDVRSRSDLVRRSVPLHGFVRSPMTSTVSSPSQVVGTAANETGIQIIGEPFGAFEPADAPLDEIEHDVGPLAMV